MSRLFVRLFLGGFELGMGSVLAVLLAWQVLVTGVLHGLAACLLFFISGPLLFLALLTAHEFGHLIAGWAVGLQLVSFTAGPLQVVLDRGRMRARLNTALLQPAAYVNYRVLKTGERPLRWAVMVLGGPVCNLLLSGVCLVSASWINPGPPEESRHGGGGGLRRIALLFPGDLFTAHLNIAGIASLVLGMGALVPGRVAGLRTDGGQLVDLLHGDTGVESTGISKPGTRPPQKQPSPQQSEEEQP